jgi:hypothetical protein
VVNRCWKCDPFQIMIFVCVCSSWSIVKLKTRFETWIIINDANCVNLFHSFLFNNSYGLPVFTKDTKCPNQVFYVWLDDLQNIWAKFGLETCLSPNNDIRICLLDMRHIWTKNAFWTWITRNEVNGVVFHFSYLVTPRVYLCS